MFLNPTAKSLENATDNNLFVENYNVKKKELVAEDKHDTKHPVQSSSYHNNRNSTQCNIVNITGNAMRHRYKHSHAHSTQWDEECVQISTKQCMDSDKSDRRYDHLRNPVNC